MAQSQQEQKMCRPHGAQTFSALGSQALRPGLFSVAPNGAESEASRRRGGAAARTEEAGETPALRRIGRVHEDEGAPRCDASKVSAATRRAG